MRVFEKGAIHDLIWIEGGLTTSWKTQEIKGGIVDYQIRDVDHDGEEELVLAVIAQGEELSGLLSKKSRSKVYFFKLF